MLKSSIVRKLCWASAGSVALTALMIAIVQWVLGQPLHAQSIAMGAAFAAVPVMAFSYWLGSTIFAGVSRAKALADVTLGGAGRHSEHTRKHDEIEDLTVSMHLVSSQVRDLVSRLHTESARNSLILSNMVEGVLAVDELLQVTICNRSFVQALGITEQVKEGTPLRTVCRDLGLIELIQSVLRTGQRAAARLKIRFDDPRVFDVEAAPLPTESSVVVLVIMHDVTELERLERVRQDFVANVSHELRTPLAAILGYAETLLRGAINDEQVNRRFVDVIRTHAIRLTNISSDLLTLGKLDRDTSAPFAPVPLRATLMAAVRALEFEATERQVKIRADDLGDMRVLAERVSLEQVFVNLLANAVKFNRPEGEVVIRCETLDDNRVQITIRDTGIGIPSEDLGRIFERFYRVDKARSRAVGGTGLGLSIVKNAVERLGGNVTVESQLGRGSTFHIVLPLAEVDIEEPEEQADRIADY